MRSSSCGVLLPLLPLVLAACVHNPSAEAPTLAGSPASSAMAARGPLRPTVLDGAELARESDRPLAEVIASRIPGARVLRASDGSLTLQLRGAGSFFGDGQPLIVIDGLEIDASQPGTLAMVNPHDVASLEVLKDAASLSMYGVRGSNGVVVITTKHGRR